MYNVDCVHALVFQVIWSESAEVTVAPRKKTFPESDTKHAFLGEVISQTHDGVFNDHDLVVVKEPLDTVVRRAYPQCKNFKEAKHNLIKRVSYWRRLIIRHISRN